MQDYLKSIVHRAIGIQNKIERLVDCYYSEFPTSTTNEQAIQNVFSIIDNALGLVHPHKASVDMDFLIQLNSQLLNHVEN